MGISSSATRTHTDAPVVALVLAVAEPAPAVATVNITLRGERREGKLMCVYVCVYTARAHQIHNN